MTSQGLWGLCCNPHGRAGSRCLPALGPEEPTRAHEGTFGRSLAAQPQPDVVVGKRGVCFSVTKQPSACLGRPPQQSPGSPSAGTRAGQEEVRPPHGHAASAWGRLLCTFLARRVPGLCTPCTVTYPSEGCCKRCPTQSTCPMPVACPWPHREWDSREQRLGRVGSRG